MNKHSILHLLCDQMTVEPVSARLYRCGRGWRMDERVIQDDMFFYILQGKGRARIEDRAFDLSAGACLHFRRNVRHSGTHDPEHPIVVIALHYNATILHSLPVSELLEFPDRFVVPLGSPAAALLKAAVEEEEAGLPGKRLAAQAIVTQLLLHFIRATRNVDDTQIDWQEARHRDLLRMQPALHKMNSNLSAPVPMPVLAKSCGLSVAQFRKVFTRSLRCSPVHYLHRLRMSKACSLLRETTETIETIAEAVGYRETSFFARTFKQAVGVPPGRFRTERDSV